MKLKFFRFSGDDYLEFPRGHLRWLDLPNSNTLKFGFSSGSVVITGENLHLLMRDIVTGKVESVHIMPPEHKQKDAWFVQKISS